MHLVNMYPVWVKFVFLGRFEIVEILPDPNLYILGTFEVVKILPDPNWYFLGHLKLLKFYLILICIFLEHLKLLKFYLIPVFNQLRSSNSRFELVLCQLPVFVLS